MARESELLIRCPHCRNEGFRRLDDGGYGPCVCRVLRVVGTGWTVGQVEQALARTRAEQQGRAELSERVRG